MTSVVNFKREIFEQYDKEQIDEIVEKMTLFLNDYTVYKSLILGDESILKVLKTRKAHIKESITKFINIIKSNENSNHGFIIADIVNFCKKNNSEITLIVPETANQESILKIKQYIKLKENVDVSNVLQEQFNNVCYDYLFVLKNKNTVKVYSIQGFVFKLIRNNCVNPSWSIIEN